MLGCVFHGFDFKVVFFHIQHLIVSTIIDEFEAPEPDEGRRLIGVESMKPGQEFYLGFTDRLGNPYPRRFTSEFDLRLLESPP